LEEHGKHIAASPLKEYGEPIVVSPLETLQLTSPLWELKMSPSEGAGIGLWFVAKMLLHVMPIKTVRIPIAMMKMRKDEIVPLVGLFGHPLQSSLTPDKKLEVQWELVVFVEALVSAVTPSPEEEFPSVLLILVGCIW
jgi:hypothetical protein